MATNFRMENPPADVQKQKELLIKARQALAELTPSPTPRSEFETEVGKIVERIEKLLGY